SVSTHVAPVSSSPLVLHDALPIFRYNGAENRTFVSTNIRILPSLSVTHFLYKRLNILFTGYPHRLGRAGKRVLRFPDGRGGGVADRKSTRLNSSHVSISYAVFCLE